MSYLTELDNYYINSITSLHSIDHLINGEPSHLQLQLEDALINKIGSRRDLSSLVAAIKQPTDLYKNLTSTTIEEKTNSSSDNELELDLLKEDLMCIICKGMDVAAKNRLLECSDCHSLYHQECHRPVVTTEEADTTWFCLNCKEVKKAKIGHSHSSKDSKSSSKSSSSSYKSSKSSSSYKSSDKYGSKSSSSNSESRNLMSADKRIQNMKKKAAKIHDKR